MSVRRSSRFAGRLTAALLVGCLLLSIVSGPALAIGAGGLAVQENGTAATDGTDSGANGSQIETAAGTGGGESTGIIGSAFGFVGGLLGGLGSFLGGLVGALVGFLDSSIGHALVGIPLGIYLGLKSIALYLEYYE
ncbi:hypothetical protein [Halorientalis halophila]|uniref:hypothetical protein n=1 Tax=Halorientalis halophila TaxID=3108499 RepID=UPI003009F3B6